MACQPRRQLTNGLPKVVRKLQPVDQLWVLRLTQRLEQLPEQLRWRSDHLLERPQSRGRGPGVPQQKLRGLGQGPLLRQSERVRKALLYRLGKSVPPPILKRRPKRPFVVLWPKSLQHRDPRE